ncbi:protein MARD1 [Citrus sinensis]|uniref:Protein MARD1 n=1 Tax=Citrus sinensis TaxID=2711 RepID=A0ACB8MIT0_CITSI|nr:protein MARD1 [Citrus sinensis]
MTTKQILMADHHSSQSSHSQNYQRPPVPSFFGSPRFKAFTKAIGETHEVAAAAAATISPTSILDAAPSLHLSPSGSANSATQITKDPPAKVINCTECLSPTEMELSEEYTCVIAHGPNPKTTRIFDNCIIESYCSVSDSGINESHSTPENFLSFCYTCKRNLEQTNDIYIYRGEKAFCSQECRYQEMLRDDEVEN